MADSDRVEEIIKTNNRTDVTVKEEAEETKKVDESKKLTTFTSKGAMKAAIYCFDKIIRAEKRLDKMERELSAAMKNIPLEQIQEYFEKTNQIMKIHEEKQ